MSFVPSEHFMQIKNRQGATDYLPVQWRLVWFREQCPNGTIDTEEIVVDLDREMEIETFAWNQDKRKSEKVTKRAKGYARFKAIVTDGKGGRATGTKSESAASFPDFIEKAETGAIGRALAALGYGTQFAGDEFSEGERIVDSPVDNHNGQGSEIKPSPDALVGKDKAVSLYNYAFKLKLIPTMHDWQQFKANLLEQMVPDEKMTQAQYDMLCAELAKRKENIQQAS